uniref:Uncharacterized protein n=1 Tax=Arundo donax TaxID=35708 RepID=A0A0A8ZXR9_ARUDO
MELSGPSALPVVNRIINQKTLSASILLSN